MNPIFKTIIIIIVVIILLGCVGFGFIFGFPWEHIKAVSNAKKYVINTYNLTPTKVTSSMGPDKSVNVIVATKEHDFVFNIYSVRGELNKMRDNYLVKMTASILSREINDYVNKITNDQGEASVYMNVPQIKSISLSELIANPDLVFERLHEDYTCSISFDDAITINDYSINYNTVYDIYNEIFKIGLEPIRIYFSYYTEKGNESVLSISIEKENFPSINSLEDIKPYFEEAIKKAIQSK